MCDPSHACAVFDLQVYIPRSLRKVLCFIREGYPFIVLQRESSEIGTCVYMFIRKLDELDTKTVALFADSYGGQNKNTIVAAMLLYVVHHSSSLEEITLNFFGPNHGQSEGDSAHSTIAYAIKQVGDIFIPSQFIPIFRLAKRKKPYTVHAMQPTDFLDFKQFSKDMRLNSVKSALWYHETIKWTKITELRVKKTDRQMIFFETYPSGRSYKCLSLKMQCAEALKEWPKPLVELPKLPSNKYQDLLSLCQGQTPVIQSETHKDFNRQLHHEEQ
ncbi:hypothetical protein PR048_004611 [Dryococelus australis]|uniref:Uncharacterized protein n=1 Tax=Dryococelus australis TaxID=614101 RepID=A0ABQ9I712_9NEOP|nr:hypothetical protein PR048_004611 [Dryococelus australis]